MLQQGQVFRLKGGTDEASCWAYRHRVGGRDSRRVQRGVGSPPSGTRPKRSSGRWSGCAMSEVVGAR